MSLPIDAAPPGHLPPAASAPWPLQPPPHGASARSIPVKPIEAPARKGPFGLAGALVAGAAAAAVGLAVAIPLLIGRKAKPAARTPRKRRAKA